MFGIGTQELIIILVILLVLFGGSKLPELSRGVGQAIKEIRKGFATENKDESEKDKTEKNEK